VGDKSDIQWTDATWNPAVGCSKVSTGCLHCYAEMVHETRLSGRGAYPVFRPWTKLNADHNVTFVPARLDQPLRWRKPRMIFVNSMSDLFHENLLPEQIAAVFAVMHQADWRSTSTRSTGSSWAGSPARSTGR
jgi:protein gp37